MPARDDRSTSAETVRVRFAPSPTGRLHVGNARIALLNFLFARRHGGKFLLRLDDTDWLRSKPEYAAAILADLAWLGLSWEGPIRQSERLARYRDAAEALKASGRLYACYETETELAAKRASRRARGLPPLYDRAGLRLSAEERRAVEAEGRHPHWRFRLSDRTVLWHDLAQGERHVSLASLSDPVLIRADGSALYTFSSVVDDRDLAITHIIRGVDHVTNAAVQIDIWEALRPEVPLPIFAHLPLLTDAGGEKLSKRVQSVSIQALREQGIEAAALTSYLARLGAGGDVAPASLDELARSIDLSAYAHATTRFDMHQLQEHNHRLLRTLPYAAVADRLPSGADARFWEVVRGNIATIGDAEHWWRVVAGDIAPAVRPEDAAFLRAAAELLPPEPWGEETFSGFAAALKAASGRRGRALFHPLRLALTGAEDGPELARLLPLMGRARAARRLGRAARGEAACRVEHDGAGREGPGAG